MRERATYKRIGVAEAQMLLSRAETVVFDVRDGRAFAQGHITGARNITISDIPAILSKVTKPTPLLICCYHGNASQEYARVFCDFGFLDVYSLDGGFEAWQAAGRPDAGRLGQWLRAVGFAGYGLEQTGANGMTPLMAASRQGQIDALRQFIAAGAKPNARNDDGNNALWLACAGGHMEAIDMLIEAGVDIDNQNDNGATALMYAASAGKHRIVERLLQAGADIRPETLDGFTATDMAATLECLTLLRRHARPREGAGT